MLKTVGFAGKVQLMVRPVTGVGLLYNAAYIKGWEA